MARQDSYYGLKVKTIWQRVAYLLNFSYKRFITQWGPQNYNSKH